MAEKNTQDNQNSKKKHKWIGIFLVALLILFIGLAGYYLERDLEPMPDNQIEDSKVLDESADSSKEAAMNSGEESETTETEEITATEETPKIEEEIKEDTASNEGAVSSDMKTESEQPAVEQSTEKSAGVEQNQEVESDDALVEDKDSSMTADSDVEKDKVEKESDIETESGVSNQQQEEMVEDLDSETEVEKLKTEDSESDIEDSSVEKDGLMVSSDQNQEADSDTEELDKSDIDQESEDFVEDNSPLDSQVDSEGQAESESQNDFSQELEDPTLLERILSILGLSDSSFSQDLNILFVGLDDEESVAVGTIEADSIMLVKLRPEIGKLQLEHIDEDTNYKGQLLRKYHNGDIQLAVEEITETEIDYYVYVNYQGFEKVIDELGGVKITLNKEVKVPGLGLNLKAGDNLLSGKEALNFVRWKGSDSMARFERQKLLINSVVTKLKSNNILFNVKELYNTIVEGYNSIETDINPVLAAEIFNYLRENDELELEFIE